MRIKLRRRRPVFEATAVLVLLRCGVEVYRLDLPMAIGEDQDGLYPFISDINSHAEPKVEWDEIRVETKHRVR